MGAFVAAPAAFNSTAHGCALQYADSTSPRLTGDVGSPSYPRLLSFTVVDDDNGDEEYGPGDSLILQFDSATNRYEAAGGGTNSSGSARAAVDALLSFSSPLGREYSGTWTRADRYEISVIDARGAAVVIGGTRVHVATYGLRNAAGDASTSHNETALLGGDFGRLSEPAITRLTVVVTANATNYTDGDTVVVHMDMRTNQGGGGASAGDKAYVDALFGFSDPLGADYSGAWADGEGLACADGGLTTLHPCFVITILDARTGRARTGYTIGAPSVHVRSVSGASARGPARLGGDLGRRLHPLLVDLHVSDADNSDAGLDAGDVVTIVFDVPTDLGADPPQLWGTGVGGGATSGGADYVDSLFTFCDATCDAGELSPYVAADYSGAWVSETTF